MEVQHLRRDRRAIAGSAQANLGIEAWQCASRGSRRLRHIARRCPEQAAAFGRARHLERGAHRRRGIVRRSDARVSPLELFFDLVFVFAMALLLWLISYVCIWFVVRYVSWWGAVLPSGTSSAAL